MMIHPFNMNISQDKMYVNYCFELEALVLILEKRVRTKHITLDKRSYFPRRHPTTTILLMSMVLNYPLNVYLYTHRLM